jgi:nucleoside-diphosphate-sugar epimerase
VRLIVHAAAMLKVPWRQAFYDANVGGTANIAWAASLMREAPTLVVISSMAAAGPAVLERGGASRPRREADRPAPVSRYGRVKLAAEEAALAHAGRVPITIVRPPMVFGPGDTVSFPLFRAASRGLSVEPTRERHRLSMIHVEDLAEALLLAAERGERAIAGGENGRGVYHVAASERLTLSEIGEEAGRSLGLSKVRSLRLPSPLTFVAAAVGEAVGRLRDRPSFLNLDKYKEGTAGSFTCDPAKLLELGFVPEKGARERIAETARWYRQEGWL